MSRPAVFLFPGQGSQYVGMGKDFHDAMPAARRRFEEASDLLGMDLKALCFEGPATTLVQTDNVQPAITLVNIVCFETLAAEGILPVAAAGHSLGEYAALFSAGVFSFADAMKLVQFRGRAMKDAADANPGGMVAVFGLDADAAAAICDEVKNAGSVEVANHNSPSQVILTGETAGIEAATALAKKKGAKLTIPLKVSGPWHSRFMSPARDAMTGALRDCTMTAPRFPVISNVTGEPHAAEAKLIRESLAAQMVSPVRWSSSIQRLAAMHDFFIEAGPGKVLTGLMKDIARDAKAINVQDNATLAKLRELRSEPPPA